MADKKPQLLDQYGRPVDRALLTQEKAGPTLTGVRSPLTGYPADGLNPRRIASLLREADQGEPLRYLELAEQIEERDPHYAGVLGTRKRSVSQLEITVAAASDDADAVKQADMVRDWLQRDELTEELFDILDAVGKGWSATEILWDNSEGQHWPARLEWRDPRWFRFHRKDGRTPLLRTDRGDVELPGFCFILAQIKAKSGIPLRSGIARLAAWNWMFKAFTQRDWAIFTQTFGQPVRVGKYHSGATQEDKDTLLRAVRDIAGDCAAIVPEQMLIEFVELKDVGQGSDLYLQRSDWLDKQISKAVLGQTATTDAEVGGLGSGKEHRQVQEDIERADARALAAILNRDLIRPFIDLNFSPQKLYPRLKIGRAEQRDLTQTVTALRDLVPMGLEVQMSEVRDMIGFSDPEKGAALLTAPAQLGMPPGAALKPGAVDDDDAAARARKETQSERPRLPTQDEIAAEAAREADQSLTALLNKMQAIVAESATLDELRARLASLDLPAHELAAAMRQALILARLMGRFELARGLDAV